MARVKELECVHVSIQLLSSIPEKGINANKTIGLLPLANTWAILHNMYTHYCLCRGRSIFSHFPFHISHFPFLLLHVGTSLRFRRHHTSCSWLACFSSRGLFQFSEDVAKANGVRGHRPHAVAFVAVECPGPPCEGNSAKITEGELLRTDVQCVCGFWHVMLTATALW